MSKSLSSDMDEVFQLQGLNWITRKALSIATVTLRVNHYTSDDQKEHIDVSQTVTGGIKGTDENRILDWQERPHSDHIFGNVVGQSRRREIMDVDDDFLSKGWDDTTKEHGTIESWVVCGEGNWTAHQIWGFQVIDGERRYVRHLKFVSNNDNRKDKTLVYDYIGPLI